MTANCFTSAVSAGAESLESERQRDARVAMFNGKTKNDKDNNRRSGLEKHIVLIVLLGTIAFLTAGALLSVLSERKLREVVAEQFNQEQLVIARNISDRIEHEISRIKKEIMSLGVDLLDSKQEGGPAALLQRSFLRVRDMGVWKIVWLDSSAGRAVSYPDRTAAEDAETIPILRDASPYPYHSAAESVWVSRPQIGPAGIQLQLCVDLPPGGRGQIQFFVNLSWMLPPMLKQIRSGKTGYAWLINDSGVFLHHPKTGFIGQNAFTVREKVDPLISYASINDIQRTKMLRGKEGTGWYYSAWHRGQTGKLKKLIAFAPIQISRRPLQMWSVAVVAPISEIEDEVQKGFSRQFIMQGLIIVLILAGAALVFFFEKRWSNLLEDTVMQRTADLAKSEEKYRSLVESAEDFIFTVDRDGCIQSMNSFTASFFGGRTADFIGKHIGRIFPKKALRQQLHLVDVVSRQGKSARGEFELENESVTIWINANFMPIKNEAGEVVNILCIARDITENKNLERQLVNAEKLASLGTLAAGVAHEINNPLGVILGFSDLLLRKTDKSSQAYEDLKTIERQGLHCKEVVENLLSFARLGAGDGDASDINYCLREIVKIVRHVTEMNHIDLFLDLETDLPPVHGDPRQLQQVFLNLINNAIASMSETGGRLSIHSRLDDSKTRAIAYFQDNGPGIPEQHMDRIFEPFFTTKPEGQGTGLGLFVSYGIVSKYGGNIDCQSQTADSENGKHGTTFIVKLPIRKQEE